MRTPLRNLWRKLREQPSKAESSAALPTPERTVQPEILPLQIAPDDPLLAYFQRSPGVVQVDELNLESQALQALKTAGVHLTVPLVSQGQLIGVLNLGARLSDQEYSSDDRRLLNNLASQLVEAHSRQHEMFGFGRLRHLLSTHAQEADTIEWLKGELTAFTGPQWVQEDDVTLVTLERLASTTDKNVTVDATPHVLAEFHVPSQPGNERQAMEQVVAAVTQTIVLPQRTLDCLKTAVAEATMNAMEHGNKFQAHLTADIQVLRIARQLIVRITDHGGGQSIPAVHEPDLQAKLDGLQSPRGWGLFLIKNMVDEMRVSSDDQHHTIELIFNL